MTDDHCLGCNGDISCPGIDLEKGPMRRERTVREVLTWAWFEAHPNQPMPEGSEQVGLLLDTLEADAVARYRETVPPTDLEQKPGRWAFLMDETGDWIEVKPGTVWGKPLRPRAKA